MTFRLASLLRVRGLQVDAAAAEAARAAARAADIAAIAERRRERLVSSSFSTRGGELAFVAAVAARSASTHLFSESLTLTAQAGAEVDDAQAALGQARARAKGIERLEERHDAAQVAADLRAEQAVLDEHAGRRPATAAIVLPDATAPTGPLR